MTASSVLARRLAIVGVCVVSAVACCWLALWQWDRFSSASGTFQNLGYLLQWPLFGLFPAFMFWRMRRLRHQYAEQDEHTRTVTNEAAPPASVPSPRRNRPQARPVDDEDDPELAAYNRYLAQLHASDQQNSR